VTVEEAKKEQFFNPAITKQVRIVTNSMRERERERECVVFIVAFPDVTMYPEAAIPIWLDMLQP